MKEIILADIYYNRWAHNKVYADTILNGMKNFNVYLDKPVKEVPDVKNKFDYIKSIFFNIQYILNLFLNKNKHIHFLCVDCLIKHMCLIYIWLVILKKVRGLTITATYHVFNKNKYMNFISGLFDEIIVHSSDELGAIKDKVKVRKINYPSFLIEKQCKRSSPDKFRFGFLGGNRKEKRLDLFIEAMNKTHHDIEVVIAGTNTDLKENGLILNKESKVISRFLTDDELKELIEYIDVLVLPYDISFKGQSGPLVESAYAGKVIISSNAPIMKDTVLKYGLGEVFESGNVEDLLESIDKVIANYDNYYPSDDFWRNFSKKEFLDKYINFFKQYQV